MIEGTQFPQRNAFHAIYHRNVILQFHSWIYKKVSTTDLELPFLFLIVDYEVLGRSWGLDLGILLLSWPLPVAPFLTLRSFLSTHVNFPSLSFPVCCVLRCPFTCGGLLAPRHPPATIFFFAIPSPPTSVTVSRLWAVTVSRVGSGSHVPFRRETTEQVASHRIAATVRGKNPAILKERARREEDGRGRPTRAGEPGSRCVPRARDTTLDGW